jgi:hypothetical protein
MTVTPWDQLDQEERAAWSLLLAEPQPPPTPALDAWRRRRDFERRDVLWRAACWEQAALDAWWEGRRDHVPVCLAHAREAMRV